MFWGGRCLFPPSFARGVGIGLYLGTILATGVNVMAQAQPSLLAVSCVYCAPVVAFFSFFFALIVRLLQVVWAPRAFRFFLGFYGLFRRFPFFVSCLHLVVFPIFCDLCS